MRTNPNKRRAFLLVQVFLGLVLLVLLAPVVGRIVLDALNIQRAATVHAARTARIDAFTRRFAEEVFAADGYVLRGNELTLYKADPARGVAACATYIFSLDTVFEDHADGVSISWEIPRCSVRPELCRGPRGDLLLLHFQTTAVPSAQRAAPRTFVETFVLPAQVRESAEDRP